MSSPLASMGLPIYAEHVAQPIAKLVLPILHGRSKQLAHNQYTDNKADDYNELED